MKLGQDMATAAAAAWASKDIVNKLLGPTADYLGSEVATFAKKCNFNVNDIFARAARKLGARMEEPGQVNPRVLKGVLSDGAFTEDSLAAEYFGGVLASSRTADARDDRGLSLLAVIRDMSSFELRMHYTLYLAVKRLYDGTSLRLSRRRETERLLAFIPEGALWTAMDNDDIRIVHHCVHGLHRLNLIGDFYAFGSKEMLQIGSFPTAPEGGLVLQPSAFGTELFLWAQGRSELALNAFLDTEIQFETMLDVEIPPCVPVKIVNGVAVIGDPACA